LFALILILESFKKYIHHLILLFSPTVILFAIWTYSLIWSVLPLFSENRYVLEGLLTTCSFDYINRNLTARLFQMTLFICGFLIPLLIFILFYMLTYKALKSKGNIIRKNTQNNDLKMSVKSKREPNDDPLIKPHSKELEELDKIKKNKSSTYSQSTLNSSIRNREFKLIKIIRLNVFVFCVAWVPYALVTLYAQFGANKELYITPFSTSLPGLMAKFSSIYNPIIYVMTSDDCKKYIFLKKSR
jgi:r-opsin